MRLITQVTSLDTSSMLLKRSPRSGFFNLGNKSKSGGLSPPDFVNVFCKINSILKRKNEVCRTSELCHVKKKKKSGVHLMIEVSCLTVELM
jgi:hypothetical protein